MALDLYRPLMDIQGEMDRLFDTFFVRTRGSGTPDRAWAPLVDVYETKDEIVVTADLPGVKEKEIDVSMVGDLLTIKGERKHQREWKDESFHRIERASGAFERQISVPMPVQTDKIRALFKEGVLEIHLPKAEEIKPKQVKIEVA